MVKQSSETSFKARYSIVSYNVIKCLALFVKG